MLWRRFPRFSKQTFFLVQLQSIWKDNHLLDLAEYLISEGSFFSSVIIIMIWCHAKFLLLPKVKLSVCITCETFSFSSSKKLKQQLITNWKRYQLRLVMAVLHFYEGPSQRSHPFCFKCPSWKVFCVIYLLLFHTSEYM